MKNNGQNNGKVTETYRVLPGQDMWIMINQYLAHKTGVNTKLHFGSDEGINKPYEKGKNTSVTYAKLTGNEENIQKYIDALNVDGSGEKMVIFEKYP